MEGFINLMEQADVVPQAPETEIIICQGVPWDNSYNHVRLYNNEQEVIDFLKTKMIHQSLASSYVRTGEGVLFVASNENYIREANYVAFKNKPQDDRYKYGFVMQTKAINNNATAVYFILDVWMNSQFDIKLNPCFVERQIVKKSEDVIGRYTFPEGLETGEYIADDSVDYDAPTADERDATAPLFITSYDENGNAVTGEMRDRVFSGLQYYIPDNPAEFVRNAVASGWIDGIVGAVMYPQAFLAEEIQWKILRVPKHYTSLNGYTPKNNKLFCFPYNFLYANNNCGDSVNYKYEYFGGENCEFEYTVNVNPNPCLVSVPREYKGLSQNFIEKMTFANYAKCTLTVDTYKAWLAMSGANYATAGIASVIDDIPFITPDENSAGKTISDYLPDTETGEVAQGLIYSVLSGGLFNIKNSIRQVTKQVMQPPSVKGIAGDGINAMLRTECISYIPMTIRKEYAKIIDDFFSMFGYKICEIRQPELRNRSSWDYIKTQNCSIAGNIDTDMLVKLRAIFDNGVTIWHTNDVGNYSLENR